MPPLWLGFQSLLQRRHYRCGRSHLLCSQLHSWCCLLRRRLKLVMPTVDLLYLYRCASVDYVHVQVALPVLLMAPATVLLQSVMPSM
jgi:hypothetical protein